jgi:hypothetical protein
MCSRRAANWNGAEPPSVPRYPSDGSSKRRVVSVSESNPEEIEGRKTRINTGFSTNGRIGRSPKETEKERPEGPFWAVGGVEKGVSRPKVCEVERAENEAITRQNRARGGQARLSVRRVFSDRECFDKQKWWRRLHSGTNRLQMWTRSESSRMSAGGRDLSAPVPLWRALCHARLRARKG